MGDSQTTPGFMRSVGDALDASQYGVFNLLAGRPYQAARAFNYYNPVSLLSKLLPDSLRDYLPQVVRDWTTDPIDDDVREHFSDVLGAWGVPEGTERDVAGFAGDMILHPLNLIAGLGVASKAGKTGLMLSRADSAVEAGSTLGRAALAVSLTGDAGRYVDGAGQVQRASNLFDLYRAGGDTIAKSYAEQAARGQRSLLSVYGLPPIGTADPISQGVFKAADAVMPTLQRWGEGNRAVAAGLRFVAGPYGDLPANVRAEVEKVSDNSVGLESQFIQEGLTDAMKAQARQMGDQAVGEATDTALRDYNLRVPDGVAPREKIAGGAMDSALEHGAVADAGEISQSVHDSSAGRVALSSDYNRLLPGYSDPKRVVGMFAAHLAETGGEVAGEIARRLGSGQARPSDNVLLQNALASGWEPDVSPDFVAHATAVGKMLAKVGRDGDAGDFRRAAAIASGQKMRAQDVIDTLGQVAGRDGQARVYDVLTNRRNVSLSPVEQLLHDTAKGVMDKAFEAEAAAGLVDPRRKIAHYMPMQMDFAKTPWRVRRQFGKLVKDLQAQRGQPSSIKGYLSRAGLEITDDTAAELASNPGAFENLFHKWRVFPTAEHAEKFGMVLDKNVAKLVSFRAKASAESTARAVALRGAMGRLKNWPTIGEVVGRRMGTNFASLADRAEQVSPATAHMLPQGARWRANVLQEAADLYTQEGFRKLILGGPTDPALRALAKHSDFWQRLAGRGASDGEKAYIKALAKMGERPAWAQQLDHSRLFSALKYAGRLSKAVVTLPFPAFHVRNAILGHPFQNMTEMGLKALDPRLFLKGVHAMYDPERAGAFSRWFHEGVLRHDKNGGIVSGTGKFIPWKQLRNDTGRLGGLLNYAENDLGIGASPASVSRWYHQINPFDLENFAIYRHGGRLSTGIENRQAMTNVIHGVEQGKSLPMAVESRHRALFNYDSKNYTHLENEVLNHLMMFYKFTKGETGQGLRTLATNPRVAHLQMGLFPAASQLMGSKEADRSTARMKELTLGKVVQVVPRGQDNYGRWVCRLYVDGVDVSATMLKEGLARPAYEDMKAKVFRRGAKVSACPAGNHRVVSVSDGDTLKLDNGETVRVEDIDAPETTLDREDELLGRYNPWVANRQHLRLGINAEDNNPNYLTGLEFPLADTLDMFADGLSGAESHVLGRLQPWLRVGPEVALNRSFAFGTPITDYDTGSPVLSAVGLGDEECGKKGFKYRADPYLLHAIGASPFSRLYATAKAAVDPRKSFTERMVNLFSGMKVTTVDQRQLQRNEKMRLRAAGVKGNWD
jgi:endonuclease YncB( thermonuclease family)